MPSSGASVAPGTSDDDPTRDRCISPSSPVSADGNRRVDSAGGVEINPFHSGLWPPGTHELCIDWMVAMDEWMVIRRATQEKRRLSFSPRFR
jgi:hypothetical protein